MMRIPARSPLRWFAEILMFTYLVAVPAFAEEWTLDRTIARALDNAGTVAIEMLDADDAALDTETARTGRYPHLSFGAEANVVSDVMEIEMPLKTIRFGDYDSYSFNLTVSQVLYDGGRLAALREAGEARVRMSEFSAEAEKLAVEFRAKAAFFQVIMAERLLASAETSRDEAGRHLADTEALRSQGMALENDMVRARLRVANAGLAVTERESELTRARAGFRRMVGISSGEPVELVWEGMYVPTVDSDGEDLTGRPEFNAFAAAEDAAIQSGEAAGAGFRPSITLAAAFNYGRPGLDLPANDWMHYTTGGVRLNWNLWDWGETRREIAHADIAARKVRENRDEFARELERQLAEAHADRDEADERLALAREAAGYAASSLAVAEAAWREGMITETDYDNAHDAHAAALSEVAAAEAATWLSAARIEYVCGIRYEGEN